MGKKRKKRSEKPRPDNPAAADQGKEQTPGVEEAKGWGAWVRENLEALFFAIILVLVIRTFVLETFKIPSGSMEPTLMGDEAALVGDRILVNRLAYLFDDPQRWDVVVFKYPMNRSRNFIKRLVGLPGEEIRIRNGNVYADGKILVKTPSAQEALWHPVYPPRFSSEVQGGGAIDPADFWEGGRWSGGEKGTVEVASGAQVRYRKRITNEYWRVGKRPFDALMLRTLGELRLSLEVTPEGSGVVKIGLEEVVVAPQASTMPGRLARRWELHLAVDSGMSRMELLESSGGGPFRSTKTVSIERTLSSGRSVEVSLARADGTAWVQLDGERVAAFEAGGDFDHSYRFTESSGAWFGTESTSAHCEDLALERDIFYTSEGLLVDDLGFLVPNGHYVMLGDNSPNSRDSRKWQIRRFVRTTSGLRPRPLGVVDMETDPINNPVRAAGNLRLFYDVNGEFRQLVAGRIAEPGGVLLPDYDASVARVRTLGGDGRIRREIWLAEGEFGFDPDQRRYYHYDRQNRPQHPPPETFDLIPPGSRAIARLASGERLTGRERNRAWAIPYVVTVPRENVIGRAFLAFWPPTHAKVIR